MLTRYSNVTSYYAGAIDIEQSTSDLAAVPVVGLLLQSLQKCRESVFSTASHFVESVDQLPFCILIALSYSLDQKSVLEA